MGDKTAAVILAAGQGKRMNSSVHKQYLMLQQKPVLYYSIKAFEDSSADEIVIVAGKGEKSYCEQEIVQKYGFHKVKAIAEGGKERYHSVCSGLAALKDSLPDYVMIHDGARPFVDQAIIGRAMEAVKKYGACAAGMPVKDTIKIADCNGFAIETPPRDCLWMVQTPQVFRYGLIIEAYRKLMDEEEKILMQGIRITDDAMVVELFTSFRVKMAEGSYENIKITTPEDLIIAESYLKSNSFA